MTPVVALLLAAGRGRRFGSDQNKCFAPLGGRTILWHAYRAFARLDRIDGIVVMVGENEAGTAEAALTDQIDSRFLGFVTGGATRQASVMLGLKHLQRAYADDCPLVLVHDAARCLVSSAIILTTLDAALLARAGAAPAVPVQDTIRRVDAAGRVTACLDRAELRAMQTPQAARLDILLTAYEEAARRGLSVTDDMSALETIGYPVRLVPGDSGNLKLTTPHDLDLAAIRLAAGECDDLSR